MKVSEYIVKRKFAAKNKISAVFSFSLQNV